MGKDFSGLHLQRVKRNRELLFGPGVKLTHCLRCSIGALTGVVCQFPLWSTWHHLWWCKKVYGRLTFPWFLSIVRLREDRIVFKCQFRFFMALVTALFTDSACDVMAQLKDDTSGTLCLENNVAIHWTCQACAWQKSGRTRRARTVKVWRGCGVS